MTSPSKTAGFTLLEMLVVIAVMGVTLLLLAGYMQPHSRAIESQAAARQVAAAMRAARGLAITHGDKVAVVLPHLPAWLPVAVQAPPGGIVYAPDGSASGGRVILGGGNLPGGAVKRIVISTDWLTGRVEIDGP